MKKTIYTLFIALFLVSCGSDDEIKPVVEQPTSEIKTGSIEGTVYTQNGAKPVGGALVFTFDDNGKMYYVHSDANGAFSLQAPEGERTIHIQTGGGANFRTEIEMNVKYNENIEIPATSSKLNQVANMAYVEGSYDEIEDIITALGYTATQITTADLQNLNTISQYDIIFLNCGSRDVSTYNNATIDSNLSTFVSNGGSLYASDWDLAYLMGGDNNVSNCNETGGFIADNLLCANSIGSSGMLNGCTIPNTALATAVGFNTLDIDYDLGSWEKIQSYDPTFWEVLVENNSEALMIRTGNYFNSSDPQVAIGNDSNDNFVTICHTEDGASMTITINQNAWPAHQGHGDTLGACSSTTNNGKIYYTTFHNHAAGNIGNSGLILEYVIMNL